MARRFPAPWNLRKSLVTLQGCNGLQLVHIYADNWRIVNSLTEDEARRIARNIAKLPELLGHLEK